MAQAGGVLTRAGHTEAGCDLARLAGLEPAAVIVEILNEDGTMARRPDLETFADHHNLKIGTIADLIRYRLEQERSIERISEQEVQTEFGPFRMCCYEDHVNRTVHLALIRGPLEAGDVPLVRVHLKDTLRDVIGVQDDLLGWPLRAAMQRIAQEGRGIVVILRPEETPRDLMDSVAAIGRSEGATHQAGAKVLRTYGIGAQILRDLGVSRMRVLSAPKQMQGLSGFDLEVVEYVNG
jgi:3,4-dihydroxy 2-butanone 4-phosphate synthase/GTP cyclohydrolase II